MAVENGCVVAFVRIVEHDARCTARLCFPGIIVHVFFPVKVRIVGLVFIGIKGHQPYTALFGNIGQHLAGNVFRCAVGQGKGFLVQAQYLIAYADLCGGCHLAAINKMERVPVLAFKRLDVQVFIALFYIVCG